VREIGYFDWRSYDSEDTIRFWALRPCKAVLVKLNPKNNIAKQCSWC
jgi:hypothetical protein